ncbi:hypothetical protein HYT92_01610 [Candidatus Pacearchaeota archaeon]|nr:hypothetical protein [Candidatus Pacearchaeota archaeon]
MSEKFETLVYFSEHVKISQNLEHYQKHRVSEAIRNFVSEVLKVMQSTELSIDE